MPQKAVTGNGKKVYAWDFKNKFQALDWYREEGLFCPDCNGEMFPRGGGKTSVRLHFAHKSTRCSSRVAAHYEGDDHTAAKIWVYEMVKKSIESSSAQHVEVDVEFTLPNCGKYGRRADVILLYKGKPYCAIECQFSPLTQEELTQRIFDYNEQGIESYWLLGKKAKTPENIQTVLKYTQVIGYLDAVESQVDGNNFFDGLVC
jgi:competence CoiA-like predicted nuclease